jgi:hypothetical protein
LGYLLYWGPIIRPGLISQPAARRRSENDVQMQTGEERAESDADGCHGAEEYDNPEDFHFIAPGLLKAATG